MARSTALLFLAALAACGPVALDAETVLTCPNGHASIRKLILLGSKYVLPREIYWEEDWNVEAEAFSVPEPARIEALCTTCRYRFRDSYWYRADADPSKFGRPLLPLIAGARLPEPSLRKRSAYYFQALDSAQRRIERVTVDSRERVASAWKRILDHLTTMSEPPRDMRFIENTPEVRHQRGSWRGYQVDVQVSERADTGDACTFIQISNSSAIPRQP